MMLKRLLMIGIVLLLAGCAAALGTIPPPIPPTEEPFYAPDFTLTALDGSVVTLSAQRPRWVIINFWATWCVPCVEEMPLLQQIADMYLERLVVLGVNMRETTQEIDAFVAVTAISFPLLLNPYDSMLVEYSVTGLPQTLIVNPDGEIVDRTFGPLNPATFPEYIASLLAT